MVTKPKQKDTEREEMQALKLTLWKEKFQKASSQTGCVWQFLLPLKTEPRDTLPALVTGDPISIKVLANQTVTDTLYVTGKDKPGAPGLARNRKT